MTTVLFVHAHPDDESIMTGGTMAQTAAQGGSVVLLTATRGEGGDVVAPELAHLEGNRTGLAQVREGELARACEILGVAQAYYLGEEGPLSGTGLPARRFEDSGMVWGADGHATAPERMSPDALCAAPLELVTQYVAAVIAHVRPDVVITYGPGGGYGHPDHVRCHDATVGAVRSLGASGPALLFAEVPAVVAADAIDPLAAGFDLTGFAPATSSPVIPAEYPIAVEQDVSEFLGTKAMAMSAHHTQMHVAGQFFALSNGFGQKILDTEHFTQPGYTEEVAPSVLEWVEAHRPVQVAQEVHEQQENPAGAGIAGAGTAGMTPALAPEGAVAGGSTAPARPRKSAGTWVANVLHTVIVAALVCVLGTLQHLNASVINVGGQGIIVPWGLALAVALVVVSTWHIARSHRSTLLVVIYGVIISVGSFLLGQQELLPGFDLLLTGFYRSVIWLFTPMVVAGIMAFTLPSLRGK